VIRQRIASRDAAALRLYGCVEWRGLNKGVFVGGARWYLIVGGSSVDEIKATSAIILGDRRRRRPASGARRRFARATNAIQFVCAKLIVSCCFVPASDPPPSLSGASAILSSTIMR